MPAGHIVPPGSAQDFAQQQAALRAGQDEQKLRQGILAMALGYATVNVIQAGIASGSFVDITGLTKTVIVATKRLIKVTALVAVQQHTTKAAVQLSIDAGGGSIQSAIASVDGTTGDYYTFQVVAIDIGPTQGTRTYKVSMATGSGTFDANANTRSWLLVEDAGAAPL